MLDGHGLYGYFEASNIYPDLDACGGHIGFTPDSPSQQVYHYHITLTAPFTVGCFGPKIVDGTEALVTLADCRAAVPECDGADLITVETAHGSILYDPDCPCYDGNGSSVTNVPLPFELAPTQTASPTTPTNAPVDRPTTTSAPTQRRSVLLYMPDDMPFLWPEQPPDPATGLVATFDITLVPNMNRVRNEGVTFLKASAVSPKCAPARFNVLTGRYCSHGVYARSRGSNSPSRVNVEVPTCKIDGTDKTENLQQVLQSVGYHTIFSGKYHMLPGSEQTSAWWSNYASVAAEVVAAGFTADGGTYASNMNATIGFTHNLEWTTSLTRGAIADAVIAGSPFFAAVWPTMPHGPSPLAALRRGDPLATPNGTLTTVPNDSGMPTRQSVIDAAPSGADQSTWAGTIETDAALGSLMSKMDELNVLNSTVVIVLMDHGMISKDTLFEGGTRIAMMARCPALFSAGSMVTRPVTNLDIAPTVFELAGVAPPFPLDGESFLADTLGVTSTVHRTVIFGEMDTDRSVLHLPLQLKLISRISTASIPNHPGSTAAVQLYDLVVDPTEQVNLAGNSSYATILVELQSALACHEMKTQRVNPVTSLLCDTAAPTAATSTAPTATSVAPTTAPVVPTTAPVAPTTASVAPTAAPSKLDSSTTRAPITYYSPSSSPTIGSLSSTTQEGTTRSAFMTATTNPPTNSIEDDSAATSDRTHDAMTGAIIGSSVVVMLFVVSVVIVFVRRSRRMADREKSVRNNVLHNDAHTIGEGRMHHNVMAR